MCVCVCMGWVKNFNSTQPANSADSKFNNSVQFVYFINLTQTVKNHTGWCPFLIGGYNHLLDHSQVRI